MEIERRAREIVELKQLKVGAVPLKFLVPLLEKGCQESPDDSFMIGCWAGLLASSIQENELAPRFVSLLSEINGRQARELHALYTAGNGSTVDSLLDIVGFIRDLVAPGARHDVPFHSLPLNPNVLREKLLLRGFRFQSVGFAHYTHRDAPTYEAEPKAKESDLDLSVLESLGLVKQIPLRLGEGDKRTSLKFYGLTRLGAQLVRLCQPNQNGD